MEWSTRSMSKDGVSAQPAQKSPVQKHKGEDQHSGKGVLSSNTTPWCFASPPTGSSAHEWGSYRYGSAVYTLGSAGSPWGSV